MQSLRGQNASTGAQLDGHTLTPGWDGKPVNLVYAIAVLHPLAQRPS